MIIFNTENSLTTEKLVRRILNNRLDYEHRNQKKEEKEKAAYQVYRYISGGMWSGTKIFELYSVSSLHLLQALMDSKK